MRILFKNGYLGNCVTITHCEWSEAVKYLFDVNKLQYIILRSLLILWGAFLRDEVRHWFLLKQCIRTYNNNDNRCTKTHRRPWIRGSLFQIVRSEIDCVGRFGSTRDFPICNFNTPTSGPEKINIYSIWREGAEPLVGNRQFGRSLPMHYNTSLKIRNRYFLLLFFVCVCAISSTITRSYPIHICAYNTIGVNLVLILKFR